MKRRLFWAWLAFMVVALAQAGYTLWRARHTAQHWVPVTGQAPWRLYVAQQDYLLGASYGLAAAFTVYAWQRARERRRPKARGVLAGLSLAGFLCFPGCWLIGCCGSPLLPVYLSLFGASFLGLVKPLVFLLTLLSVSLGLWWVEKGARKEACGCGDACGDSCGDAEGGLNDV